MSEIISFPRGFYRAMNLSPIGSQHAATFHLETFSGVMDFDDLDRVQSNLDRIGTAVLPNLVRGTGVLDLATRTIALDAREYQHDHGIKNYFDCDINIEAFGPELVFELSRDDDSKPDLREQMFTEKRNGEITGEQKRVDMVAFGSVVIPTEVKQQLIVQLDRLGNNRQSDRVITPRRMLRVSTSSENRHPNHDLFYEIVHVPNPINRKSTFPKKAIFDATVVD